MKITWYNNNDTPMIIQPTTVYNSSREKIGDIARVNPEDLTNDHSKFALKYMKKFIDEDLSKDLEQYAFLKELIYSEDADNLLIALTIIDNIEEDENIL